MVLMALVMLASLSQGSLIKGLIAACLGMMVHLPGVDPSIGQMRLTFGFEIFGKWLKFNACFNWCFCSKSNFQRHH